MERVDLVKSEFDIKSENLQLSVIDKAYINGGILLKEAITDNAFATKLLKDLCLSIQSVRCSSTRH